LLWGFGIAEIEGEAVVFPDAEMQVDDGIAEEAGDPEPSLDIKTHELRDRLLRALVSGRDVFPRDAARAQADWDCWRLNATVATQLPASEACHKSFEITLPRLEAELVPVVAAKAKEEAKRKKAGPVQNDTADASERL